VICDDIVSDLVVELVGDVCTGYADRT